MPFGILTTPPRRVQGGSSDATPAVVFKVVFIHSKIVKISFKSKKHLFHSALLDLPAFAKGS